MDNSPPKTIPGSCSPACCAVLPGCISALVTHDHLRFRQRPQLFLVQSLIPKTPHEAFHKSVLPRAVWFYVDRLDLIRF